MTMVNVASYLSLSLSLSLSNPTRDCIVFMTMDPPTFQCNVGKGLSAMLVQLR